LSSQQQHHPSTAANFPLIRPIRCPRCDGQAHIARRSPHPALKSAELRIFECWACQNLIRCVAEWD
jgi:hypothetical protein